MIQSGLSLNLGPLIVLIHYINELVVVSFFTSTNLPIQCHGQVLNGIKAEIHLIILKGVSRYHL